MTKAGKKLEQENKVVVNYNSKFKINIHESTLISTNDGLHRQMEDNRQIYHVEEFQIIYAATPPSRRWRHNSPRFKCGLCIVISFQRGQCGKGGREE